MAETWGLTQFPAKEQGAFATCPMFSWGSKQFGLCLICLESEDAAYQLLTRLPGEFGGHIASPNMPEAWRISGLVWISIVVNQLEYVLSHCSGNFNCCTKRINKQLAPPPLFPFPPAPRARKHVGISERKPWVASSFGRTRWWHPASRVPRGLSTCPRRHGGPASRRS